MRLLKRLIRDARGVSAVEFALISPLLILFYFSTVEIDSALTVHRRVATVAGTVADLVAQDEGVITPAELSAIYDSAAAIMAPHDQDNAIKLRVSSVRVGTGNKARVVWGVGHNWAPRGQGTEVTMPTSIIGGTATVIMAEAEYSYSAPLSDVVGRPLLMKQTFFLRPRRVPEICYDPPGTNPPNIC